MVALVKETKIKGLAAFQRSGKLALPLKTNMQSIMKSQADIRVVASKRYMNAVADRIGTAGKTQNDYTNKCLEAVEDLAAH